MSNLFGNTKDWFSHDVASENMLYNVIFAKAPTFMILVGYKDKHKFLQNFEIQPDPTKVWLNVWKIPID